ncbi:SMU1112c/YaeR family gloxylase I-like metalloprotein [Aquibacillus rhizosphaerae]|uniref:VOC family protein n=1 Tax=Aquibacillus rhizosphaerae TaxID=3051431 RepID=A0ABT7L344_9BACI|nr:VOC family protein [Aquibacillus sp. LR5S19]MDL4840264.1 VOC family protein [Aquibacillus sp. LR5S19]
MFSSIHHVAIICSNYPVSKHFYVEKLGLKIIREVYRKERDSYKLDLALGDEYVIELFSFPSAPTRPSYPEAQGLRHIAFTVHDIDKVVTYLKEQAIEVEEIRVDEITNKRFAFFADPDQLPIEIYEK